MEKPCPFRKGYAADLPIRPCHSWVMNWLADTNNFIRLWLPENLAANKRLLLMISREPLNVGWSLEGERWQSSMHLLNRMRVEAQITPAEEAADLVLQVTNLSNEDWKQAFCGVCLQLAAAPDFADPMLERTYYPVEGVLGLVERKGRPRWATISLVDRQRSDEGFIAVASKSGKHTIAVGWTQVHALSGNNEACLCCIHADPQLGDVLKGHTARARGRVYFMSGTPQEAYERYRKDLQYLTET